MNGMALKQNIVNGTSFKLPMFLLALLFTFFLIASNIYIYQQQRSTLTTAFTHLQQSEIQILSQLARESLISEDYALIEWFFNRWGEEHSEVVSLTLRNSDSNFLLSNYQRTKDPSIERFSSSNTITHQDEIYKITLVSEATAMNKQLKELMQQLMLVSTITILLLGISIWNLFQRLAIRPLLLEIESRQKAEIALEQSAKEWIFAMDFFEDAVYLVDLNDKLVRANLTFYNMTRSTPELAVGQDISTIIHPNGEDIPCPVCRARNERRDEVIIMEPDHPDNPTGIPIQVTVQMIRDSDKNPMGVLMGIRDLTRSREEEEEKALLSHELHQAQKMEALGNLTGGIAHDFNNILGIIMGNVELAKMQNGEIDAPRMRKYLDTIQTASERARDLVAQMMVFSRKDQEETHPMDLTPMVKEDIKMLRSLLPTSIEIDLDFQNNLPRVEMDIIKFQKVLINLCLNAKDAMNGIGKLTIKLGMWRDINQECSSCHKHLDGDWVDVSVTDTGSGISHGDMIHVFEPFYTTKEVGKGTGMGLSVVDGTVRNLGGHTIIESEEGKGTTVHLLFPPVLEDTLLEDSKDESSHHSHQGSGQSILIVDDEPELAQVISEMLEVYGYQSTAITSSTEALKLFESNPASFDLVITDQTMPQLTGKDMAIKMREMRPETPIILVTGYSDSIGQEEADEQSIGFLKKPVDAINLVNLVAEMLPKS